MFQRRGSSFSDYGIGDRGSIDINAPSDLVWRLLLNVESYEKLFSTCSRVRNLNGRNRPLNPVVPGSRYAQTRAYSGRRYFFKTYVTVVDPDNHECSISTTCKRCTATSTISIDDLDDNNTAGGQHCRVLMSYSMIPDGWRGRLYLWRNKKKLERDGYDIAMTDLEDLKYAAENGHYKGLNEPITDSSTTTLSRSDDIYGRLGNRI